jgi:hypothetical protein
MTKTIETINENKDIIRKHNNHVHLWEFLPINVDPEINLVQLRETMNNQVMVVII